MAIISFSPESIGIIKCAAQNIIGYNEIKENIIITNLHQFEDSVVSNKKMTMTILYSVVIAFTLGALICGICFYLRIRREKMVRQVLLANFEKGCPDDIDPEMALCEQGYRLPYDKKYEFPYKKLKFAEPLGAGAFGLVIKASALGILPNEAETTVAVKMVNHYADREVTF